ncbi:hypothetical protein DFH09DRAFT_1182792 [Mycena vulgaris]|nr:hypothetical protein DFH09DRAFT_1182792 [Mycena vulgaris]
MVSATFQLLALAALATQLATAAPAPALVTVLVPLGDETTPMTAAVLGVDSQGRTTYAIQDNEMQGTSILASATATLVEASDYMSYTYSLDGPGINIVLGADCTLNGRTGVCTGLDESSHAATATISSLAAWVLDVPPTGSPGGPPLPTGKSNSSQRTSASIFGALVGLAVAYQLL